MTSLKSPPLTPPGYAIGYSKRFILSHSHLREFALLVDERDQIHGPSCNHVQNILIVNEFDLSPADSLRIVFLLFQLENVLDEELLQVFVGIINA